MDWLTTPSQRNIIVNCSPHAMSWIFQIFWISLKKTAWNHVWEILLSWWWWWWGPKVLSDNKCAAEMGVMPLLRLLPMIVIAPFCSRSQQYKLAFLCLSLYFYNFKIQFLLSVNLTFEQYCEFLSESFCIFGSGLSNSFDLIYLNWGSTCLYLYYIIINIIFYCIYLNFCGAGQLGSFEPI